MLRTNRLTSALAGRGKAVAAAGAAAAVLAGGGAASAATLTGSDAASAATVTSAHLNAPATGAAAAVLTGAASAATLAGAASAATLAPAATAHTATAHTVTADGAAAKPAVHKPAAAKPAAVKPARPYQIYDSVTPSAIPAHARIATYADGGYAVAPAQVAHRGHVLWIDTNGADPHAAALDVEPGDATPAMAATWAWHKLHAAAGSVAIIYTMRSEWAAAQAAVHHLPAHMQSHVRWWIADPTGVNHIVPGAISHPVVLGPQLRHHHRQARLLSRTPEVPRPYRAGHFVCAELRKSAQAY